MEAESDVGFVEVAEFGNRCVATDGTSNAARCEPCVRKSFSGMTPQRIP